LGYVHLQFFKKTAQVNNYPRGKYSPNLVTLVPTDESSVTGDVLERRQNFKNHPILRLESYLLGVMNIF
jgi:hypothetical protein